MQSKKKSTVFRIAIISVAVFLLVFAIYSAGILVRAENMTYDSRMRLTADTVRPSEEIVLVLVDQQSIDWANREMGWGWPWPRRAYADIVRYFDAAGAASVAFDMLFTEPSVYGAEDDENFANASHDYGRVVQTVFFDEAQGTYNGWKNSAPLPFDIGDGVAGNSPALFPIDAIAGGAAALGNIDSVTDSDGTIRSAKNYFEYGSYKVPSLGIASLAISDSETHELIAASNKPRLLRFQSDLQRYAPYGASQILQSYYAIQKGEEPLIDVAQFENMYVFFGLYAPGLFDICTTPVSSVYPGVGVHVTQLDNFLQQKFLSPANNIVCLSLIFIFAVLGAIITSMFDSGKLHKFIPLVIGTFFIVVIAAYLLASYIIFANGIVVPVAAPIAGYVLSFTISILVSYNIEGKQKRYLKSAFKQYLSPAVIEELIAHPERLALGGERREISIFFSDLQGFTSISEKLEPQELTSILNEYLSAMTDVILESGGTIDKYEGDAIIAFWNAPVNIENHAKVAIEATICCQQKLAEIRKDLEARVGKPFLMRIGMNTGAAIVGNMGSHNRFDYTMMGDAVNLAARLEGLNKQFGTYTMCTKATKMQAEKAGTSLCFRELARAEVVGKKESVTVYEPMTKSEYTARADALKIFSVALQKFYAGDFSGALAIFERISKVDPAAEKYAARCCEFLTTPPDMKNWQGVWVARGK